MITMQDLGDYALADEDLLDVQSSATAPRQCRSGR